MGLRGPAPLPTALRVMEGNRSRRPLPQNEPQPTLAEPDCPSHLDAIARREWKRLVEIFGRLRVLSELDGIALASICQSYSRMHRAEKEMRRLEREARKSGGNSVLLIRKGASFEQNPLLKIIHRELEYQQKALREFGMTPSSRTRVQAQTTSSDPIDNAIAPRRKTA